MKKIIFLLAFFATINCFAGQPSVKDLAATDQQLISDIYSIKVQLLERDSQLAKQNAMIDSLQSYYIQANHIIKKPVTNKDDLSILLGFLLGVITYVFNNVVYKIKGVKEWVEEKFSKSAVTISLGALATAITVVVIKLNGSTVGWMEVLVWLVSAWGTHFGAFVAQVKKVKE